MSRSSTFIVTGAIWTLATVLLGAGFQLNGEILAHAGWLLSATLFCTCTLALFSTVTHSALLRSLAFILHLLAPLAWTLWLGTAQNTAFSFGTWGLVSLMALVGAVVTEHGLEMEFEGHYACDASLEKALREAARPIISATPALDTGSLKIRR